MASITLEWDQSLLKPFKRDGLERALVRSLSRAGGDAIRAIRIESSRVVRERKRMKLKRVNTSLVVDFPRSKSHVDDLVWKMSVSGKPIPVSEYPYRQVKSGVSVAINKGSRTLIRHAFAAMMKSGHVGIFLRRGKKRLPIDEVFTTRVSDVFNDAGMVPQVFARGQAVFSSTFARLLPLELEKVKR